MKEWIGEVWMGKRGGEGEGEERRGKGYKKKLGSD